MIGSMGNQGQQNSKAFDSFGEDDAVEAFYDRLAEPDSSSRPIPERTELTSGWAAREGLDSEALQDAVAFVGEAFVEEAPLTGKRRTLDPAKYAGPEFDDEYVADDVSDPISTVVGLPVRAGSDDWTVPSRELHLRAIPNAPLPAEHRTSPDDEVEAELDLDDLAELSPDELDDLYENQPTGLHARVADTRPRTANLTAAIQPRLDSRPSLYALPPSSDGRALDAGSLVDHSTNAPLETPRDAAPYAAAKPVEAAPIPLARLATTAPASAPAREITPEKSGAIDFDLLAPAPTASLAPASLSSIAPAYDEPSKRSPLLWLVPVALVVAFAAAVLYWPSPAQEPVPTDAVPRVARVLPPAPSVVDPSENVEGTELDATDVEVEATDVATEVEATDVATEVEATNVAVGDATVVEAVEPSNAATPVRERERQVNTNPVTDGPVNTAVETVRNDAIPETSPPAEAAEETLEAIESTLPLQPSREQVQDALNSVRDEVRACMPIGGRVPVEVTIVGRTGRVVRAEVQDAAFARQPIGGCIARAVRGAHVEPFQQARLVVTYPFVLP